MKKVCVLLFLTIVVATVAFAAIPRKSNFDVSDPQTKESETYSRGLYIEEKASKRNYKSKQLNDWQAYLGPNTIKQSEFFRIAGYEDLAKQVAKVEKTNKILRITGLVSVIAGPVVGTTIGLLNIKKLSGYWDANEKWQEPTRKNPSCIYGPILIGSGVGVGIFLLTKLLRVDLDISPDFAVQVANDYNHGVGVRMDYRF